MAGAVRRVGAAAARANGLGLVYLVAVVNSALGVCAAFGAQLTDAQQAAVVLFVNTVLLAGAHLTSNRRGTTT